MLSNYTQYKTQEQLSIFQHTVQEETIGWRKKEPSKLWTNVKKFGP